MVIEKLIAAVYASRKHVVVIGDALIDVWVHGYLAPSQDGCDKFIETERVSTPGGAANAANCLRHWHAETSLWSVGEIHRGVKTRFVGGNFRHDNETQAPPISTFRYWRKEALATSSTADAILLSDYDKGFLTEEFVTSVVRRAKCPVVADAKRRPSVYDGCILKCNEDYATRYPEVLSRENTVVTLGAQFPQVIHAKDTMTKTPSAVSVPCINHVGAGDCFAAHLTLALAHGFSLEDAATVAHAAGRVYVQHLHNRPPYPKELL